MRLLVNRLLIGLLVSGWLNIDFGRGTAKLELIPGLLEFSQALAETTEELAASVGSFDPAGFEELAATRAAFKGFCWRFGYLDAPKL